MLNPDKHTNLKFSILNVSGHILKFLIENNIVKYNDLLLYLSNNLGNGVKDVFIHSLSFLYIFGKIEYIKELDAIKFVQNENK